MPGLIDRATSLEALRAHRLQLLAASLWRSRREQLPSGLRAEERRATMTALAAVAVLRRVRAAYGGPLMLMKGPEVAASYPEPRTRPYNDIDLLADDPVGAQRALLDAGFVPRADQRDHSRAQHLDPLMDPELALIVEIHRRPNCPSRLVAPTTDELFSLGVPSVTGIEGLIAPSPAAHALLLAAHAWAHHPLGRVGDLIDVAAVLPPDERRVAAGLARRWGWARMWETTLSAADALLGGGPEPFALRTWARHLGAVSELSVLDNHVVRMIAPGFALPPRHVPVGIAIELRGYAELNPGERWPRKLGRTAIAVRDAFTVKSQHDSRVGLNPWHR
ncbi:MAG TPA: nucleotidyltransferase family protein [Solirubrobacteraceae bacterium]|nr:nucleotidyltransferase family protein [Solirubrobacteraceae bacterium]